MTLTAFLIIGLVLGRWNFVLWLDQGLNVLLGGSADETFSSRAHRRWRDTTLRRWKVARAVINAIFFWQDDHCFEAYRAEVERRQLPREFQGVQ